jgi:dipeptidyl aminopeptidase/acylaminoacyl peptidase
MLGASPAASRIDPERVGFFGFSLGGYTGLVPITTRETPPFAATGYDVRQCVGIP